MIIKALIFQQIVDKLLIMQQEQTWEVSIKVLTDFLPWLLVTKLAWHFLFPSNADSSTRFTVCLLWTDENNWFTSDSTGVSAWLYFMFIDLNLSSQMGLFSFASAQLRLQMVAGWVQKSWKLLRCLHVVLTWQREEEVDGEFLFANTWTLQCIWLCERHQCFYY